VKRDDDIPTPPDYSNLPSSQLESTFAPSPGNTTYLGRVYFFMWTYSSLPSASNVAHGAAMKPSGAKHPEHSMGDKTLQRKAGLIDMGY
jgi:hypothetical protein